MSVGLVGTGPAIDAVAAALSDGDASAVAVDGMPSDECSVVVNVAPVGDDSFERINDWSLTSGRSWISIELGGIGGHSTPTVEASISEFTPRTACFECLRKRVESTISSDIPTEKSATTASTNRGIARLAGAIAGRNIVDSLQGNASTHLGGIIELPYRERTLLPLPNCSACDRTKGSRTIGQGYDVPGVELKDEYRPLTNALSRAEKALDERVGIVTTVGEAASFPVPYYLAELAETNGFSDTSAASNAAGVAEDWDTAFMKALGEGLERYSAGVYQSREFDYGRLDEIENAIAPSRFVRPDPDEGNDGQIPWVEGADLVTGNRVSLPAEFVFFPPPSRRFRPSITTGLGLGNSPVGAVLSGLYEVIERDATMLAWYSTFEPLGLVIDDDDFDSLSRRAQSQGLDVTALLVTQDIDVPVVTVAVHRKQGEWPRFAVGSSANMNPTIAARAALCEALQNWMEMRSMGKRASNEQSGWIGRYAAFPPEVQEMVTIETAVPIEQVSPGSIPSGSAELGAVLQRVSNVGCSAYVAWITPRDVRFLGFEAVRVLVPEAQPLFIHRPFFGDRADRVPRELGYEPFPHIAPHPYP